MRIAARIAIAGLVCSAVACSPRDFLTRRLAADLISGSAAFRAPQYYSFRTGLLSNQEFGAPETLMLEWRGWIIGTQKWCPPGFEPRPCWDVVLSPAGVDVFRPLMSAEGGQVITVPVARRELVEITGISKAGNFADVEFTWHWLPLNEVGAALYDSDTRYRSTAAFRRYDDGWRVVTKESGSNQSMEDAVDNAQSAR